MANQEKQVPPIHDNGRLTEITLDDSRIAELMLGMFTSIRVASRWSNLMPLCMIGVIAFVENMSSLIWLILAAQLFVVVCDALYVKRLEQRPDEMRRAVDKSPLFSALSFAEGALWGLMMLPFAETLGRSVSSTFVCTILILTICISCLINAVAHRWVAYFLSGFILTLLPQCIVFIEAIGPLPLMATLSLVPILAVLTRVVRNHSLRIAESQVENELLTDRLQDALVMTQYLASRDALTGLLNRRAFEEEAQHLAEKHGRADCLALVLIDLDHFKAINDTFGHAVGDVVLKKTASCLLQVSGGENTVCRGDAAVARWGGEEFILVFPAENLSAAFNIAEDIRLRIIEERDPDWPNEMLVTGSLGVAIWEKDVFLDDLINRADKAMYSAKVAGRNRTRAYHPAGCLPKQFFESPAKAG